MCILEHKSPSSLLQEMVKEKQGEVLLLISRQRRRKWRGEIKGRNEMFTVTMLGVMHMIPF